MKYLTFLVILLPFVSADYNLNLTREQESLAIVYGTQCLNLANITKEQALDLRDGRFHHVTGRMKCFTKCFLHKYGFFADHEVKPDVVLAKLGPIAGVDKVKAAQAKCDAIKGHNDCATAFKVYECYHHYDTCERAKQIIKDLKLPVVTND